MSKVAIVGLGGTGAYILDLLAKTPIRNVHLYDGDTFSTHNAFRAPGAASVDDLNARMAKVDYYAAMYASMRRNIHPHAVYVTAANVSELADADFVFLAMDSGPDKWAIVNALIAAGVPFIDTGIGEPAGSQVPRQGRVLHQRPALGPALVGCRHHRRGVLRPHPAGHPVSELARLAHPAGGGAAL